MKKGSKKNIRITRGQRIFDFFNMIFLIFLCVIMFYPMWHVVCASFSDANELAMKNGVMLLPLKANVNAYTSMFKHPLIMKSYLNSVIILVSSVSVSMILTTICAYVLSRKGVMWNKFFNKMIALTMYFHGGLVATYLLVARSLHLNDTYWALILPGALSVHNMIIMRTSFDGIPESINEAAYIDGATHWQVLWKIILPLSKSILAVMVLYYSVGVWNSWFSASIYLNTRTKFPLQLVLREIIISNNTDMMVGTTGQEQEAIGETIKYATIVFATVPILCVYPFLQKYFTKGVMIGAVKG